MDERFVPIEQYQDLQASLCRWAEEAMVLQGHIKRLEKQIAGLDAFSRSVSEALNSGDGVYRP